MFNLTTAPADVPSASPKRKIDELLVRKVCNRCKAQYMAMLPNCPYCNTKSTVAPPRCAKCGRLVSVKGGWQFCHTCGVSQVAGRF